MINLEQTEFDIVKEVDARNLERTLGQQYKGILKYIVACGFFAASVFTVDYIQRKHPDFYKKADDFISQMISFGDSTGR